MVVCSDSKLDKDDSEANGLFRVSQKRKRRGYQLVGARTSRLCEKRPEQ